jgi:serine O-acetyltransferase
MKFEILKENIIDGLIKQLSSFFDMPKDEIDILKMVSEETFERCEYCFSKISNKYFSRHGEVYFNPYHSGQYTIFLYYYSNSIFKNYPNNSSLADKVYYLNKIMNSCDLFYEIELPEIFILDHPVGSVMGRAKFGNYFTFGQNCTVGNNKGVFPSIGENVKMSANSMILGNCKIGDNVIIGAGTCVKDQDVPKNSLVFGTSPNLIIKSRAK